MICDTCNLHISYVSYGRTLFFYLYQSKKIKRENCHLKIIIKKIYKRYIKFFTCNMNLVIEKISLLKKFLYKKKDTGIIIVCLNR